MLINYSSVRKNPDGSDVEDITHNFSNVQEFVFQVSDSVDRVDITEYVPQNKIFVRLFKEDLCTKYFTLHEGFSDLNQADFEPCDDLRSMKINHNKKGMI